MNNHNNDPPIVPFADDTNKAFAAPLKVVYDIYYEWIAADNKWIKLVNTDPEPFNIPPGKYDGQIIAVKRPPKPTNTVQWKPIGS